MSLDKLTVFQMAKDRMDWAAQRQKVLSQNIANADTPDYKAQDLKELNFRNLALSKSSRVDMAQTQPGHMPSTLPEAGPYQSRTERYPYESSPDGNEVVLEEQMVNVGRTASQYKLAGEIFKKNVNLLRIAIGKGR